MYAEKQEKAQREKRGNSTIIRALSRGRGGEVNQWIGVESPYLAVALRASGRRTKIPLNRTWQGWEVERMLLMLSCKSPHSPQAVGGGKAFWGKRGGHDEWLISVALQRDLM